jgi:CRP-like cAMP-binding protein
MASRGEISRRGQSATQTGNLLLGALPADDYERIAPLLSPTTMRAKDSVQEIGEPVTAVYFPNVGVASVTMTMPDGTLVESATVGSEGLVGIEAFFSPHPVSFAQTVVQVGDATFERMPVDQFREALAASAALRDLLGRYAQVLLASAMQSAGCNALHDLPSRCARWLLSTHDRVHGETFYLSHEFLATMLGVHRPTVTVAAGLLQTAGIITYRHGKVTVLDRERLEDASCDCYRAVRAHFDRVGLVYPVPS